MLTVADLERAYNIYDTNSENVCGQVTKRKVHRVQADLGLQSTVKNVH
jgi:hypothetical protein